jgi:hypothetical protein
MHVSRITIHITYIIVKGNSKLVFRRKWTAVSGLSSTLLGSLWVRSCLGSLIFKLRHFVRVVSKNSSNLGWHRRACTVLSRSATLSQPVTTSKSSDCSLSDTPLLSSRTFFSILNYKQKSSTHIIKLSLKIEMNSEI